jgi:hypothetical protein
MALRTRISVFLISDVAFVRLSFNLRPSVSHNDAIAPSSVANDLSDDHSGGVVFPFTVHEKGDLQAVLS